MGCFRTPTTNHALPYRLGPRRWPRFDGYQTYSSYIPATCEHDHNVRMKGESWTHRVTDILERRFAIQLIPIYHPIPIWEYLLAPVELSQCVKRLWVSIWIFARRLVRELSVIMEITTRPRMSSELLKLRVSVGFKLRVSTATSRELPFG